MKFCSKCDNMYFFSVNDREVSADPNAKKNKKNTKLHANNSTNTGGGDASSSSSSSCTTLIPAKFYVPGNKLIYYCRNCGNKDESIEKTGGCIYEKNFSQDNQRIRHLVNAYTKFNITLPRIFHLTCPNNECSSNAQKRAWVNLPPAPAPATSHQNMRFAETEVVYQRYSAKELKYVYLCVHCDHIWTNK